MMRGGHQPRKSSLRRRATDAAGSCGPLVRLVCCAVAVRVLCLVPGRLAPAAVASPSAFAVAVPADGQRPGRRQALLLPSVAAAAAAAGALGEATPAEAFGSQFPTNSEVLVKKEANPKKGIRAYQVVKPAGFKQYATVTDPSGFLFRYVNSSYLSFVTRVEAREDMENFKPEDFIADYQKKFQNASGSEFKLLRGGGPPDRIDESLGIRYYEVEYTVTTQLGFDFSSLRTLHFITRFGAGPNALYLVNTQGPEETWDADSAKLKQVVASYEILA